MVLCGMCAMTAICESTQQYENGRARSAAFYQTHMPKGCLLEGSLGDLGELSESIGIGDGHVGEHLAIELHAGLLEAVHEHGVRHTVDASGGVDTGDPQTANLALLVATITTCSLAAR